MRRKPEQFYCICTKCCREFDTLRDASMHLVFGHKIKYPYTVLLKKGFLANPGYQPYEFINDTPKPDLIKRYGTYTLFKED